MIRISLLVVGAAVAAMALGSGSPCAAEEPAIRPQLVVEISEELLNRFVADSGSRVEPVRDYVLDADVSGWQETTTRVSLDLKPGAGAIRAAFRLNGLTLTDTVGVTPQALAFTNGHHQFAATKDILFTGGLVHTRRAEVEVLPWLHTRAVCPVGGGLPLIGPLVIGIAMQQAAERRPLAESIAAEKLARSVGERFNREVDAQLTVLNRQLQQGAAWPLAENLRPDNERWESTETRLEFRAAFEPAGDEPRVVPPESTTLGRFAFHQSLGDAFAERAGLSGLRVSPDLTLQALEVLMRRVEARADPPMPDELLFVRPTSAVGQVQIEFFGETPLRLQFAANELVIELHAKLEFAKDQWTPPLILRFAYVLEAEDTYIRCRPETRLVKPVDENLGAALLILQPIIRRQLQELLPVVNLPRGFVIDADDPATPESRTRPVRLSTERLTAADGWLVLDLN